MPDETCPLCRRPTATLLRNETDIQLEFWECRTCGQFKSFRRLLGKMDNDVRRALRGLAVERKIRGAGRLEISDETLPLLLAQAPENPAQAADRLLVNLARRSSEPAVFTSLNVDYDQGMAFTEAVDSLVGYLEFLQAEGFIEYTGSRPEGPNFGFRLTLRGWRRVDELHHTSASSETGFVAMSFSEGRTALFDSAIRPAVERAGWKAIRADRVHHTERIDDWILNQIRSSRFVVVDSTDDNPGASFEAGFALGVGRPVIWTVEREWMTKGIHFDFRQFNHLRWESGKEANLVNPLVERIVAAVGLGPHATEVSGNRVI